MESFVGNDDIDFTVSYQTDPYPCPYPSDFVDLRRVYQGCFQPQTNLHQANAILAHACGTTQYRDANGCH